MKSVIYRKSDLQCISTVPSNMVAEQEIEFNVIPNLGGIAEDYTIIQTDKEKFHLEKDKDGNVIAVDNFVETIIAEDKPSQTEIEFAEYVLATEDRIAQLEIKINGGAV